MLLKVIDSIDLYRCPTFLGRSIDYGVLENPRFDVLVFNCLRLNDLLWLMRKARFIYKTSFAPFCIKVTTVVMTRRQVVFPSGD